MPQQRRISFEPVYVSPPGRIPGLPAPRIPTPRSKPVCYSDRRGYIRGDLRTKMDEELRENYIIAWHIDLRSLRQLLPQAA